MLVEMMEDQANVTFSKLVIGKYLGFLGQGACLANYALIFCFLLDHFMLINDKIQIIKQKRSKS